METWLDLALRNRRDAAFLSKGGAHRSAICRAYYAVYSRLAWDFQTFGVSMTDGREGPSHKKLRPLILKGPFNYTRRKREALSKMVGHLYDLRVLADYRPSTQIGPDESREAMALMKRIFDSF